MIKYTKERDSIKGIYVLLTDTDTIFSQVIKKFTSAPYNHASLALDKELNELFSFGRKQVNNPIDAGFVKENVYEGTYKYYPNTRCILLRLYVTKEQHDLARCIIQDFQMKEDSYSYNLIGLLSIILKLNLAPKNSYFCSQFVAEVLRGMGISLWEQPCARITPNDFFFILHLKKFMMFCYTNILYWTRQCL